MRTLIITLLLSSNLAHADHWVVPPTGIVDYSGQTPSSLPTFQAPPPTTVNYPLPAWSNQPIVVPSDLGIPQTYEGN